MTRRRRVFGVAAGTVLLFLLVQLGALALLDPFQDAGMQAFDDPRDPANSAIYLVLILVATGLMLLAFRYGGEAVVRIGILLTSGLLSWYVFAALLPAGPEIGAVPLLPVLGAAAVVVGLYVYPEWWVIDATGVVIGAGAAGLFGISFGLLPALLLLGALAVYDAISVYGTEHMLTLSESVLDMRVPIMLVVPTSMSYSLLDVDGSGGEPDEAASAEPDETPGDGENVVEESPFERDALFIGLGDAVIPTVLVASAAVFLEEAEPLVGALNAPALGAMVGTLAGLLVLNWAVLKGRAHAGLPLLNGGAIVGYLLAALATGVPLATALGL